MVVHIRTVADSLVELQHGLLLIIYNYYRHYAWAGIH